MIKLAVIGAGHWGPNLIRNFHDNQLSQVCRVVDMNPERLDQVRARFPNVQVGTPPCVLSVHPVVDTKVTSNGKVSVTTTSCAAEGPRLLTVIV